MQTPFKELNTAFEEARKQVEDVEKLSQQGTDGRDMTVGERAIESPEYIEEVLNTGTDELFRCFEILTGANQQAMKMLTQNIPRVDSVNSNPVLSSCLATSNY